MVQKSKSQLNQSLIDGITTLQELALSSVPVGCRELARRLNMDPTRVNRLLLTLEQIGLARKTVKRKYTAGAGMHVLAAQSLFASGLIQHAIKPLEKLKKYGYITALGMLWRDHVSYLYHSLPGMDSTEALGRIGLYPASSGGVGISLLSSLEDEQIREVYQHIEQLPSYPGGIDELLLEIEKTRQQGYAYVKTDDNTTIAVNVGEPAVCAIGMSGWFPESVVEELSEALKEVAKEIAEDMH